MRETSTRRDDDHHIDIRTPTLGSGTPTAGMATYTNSELTAGVHSITAATGGNAPVTLSWTADAGAMSYNVYQGTSAGGTSSSSGEASATPAAVSAAAAR